MSTPDTGDAAIVREAIDQAKAVLDEARAETPQQLDMLDPVTPEEMLEARETLGPGAGRLSLLRHAREAKRRPACCLRRFVSDGRDCAHRSNGIRRLDLRKAGLDI